MNSSSIPGSLPDDALLAASAEALSRSALRVDDVQLDAALSQLDGKLTECRTPDGVGAGTVVTRARRPLSGFTKNFTRDGLRVPGWLGISRAVWYTACGFGLSALLIASGWGKLRGGFGGASSAPMTTYATHNGQRAEITLPDGSVVVLSVASRLDVPTNFAAGNRVLRLTGEALFTVGHHSGAPFTVINGPATVRVLGTRFVVRRYATDTATTIVVGEGKVGVSSVVLTEKQQVDVGVRGAGPVRAADMSRFGFATGLLTIDNMPLADAITELNRWYDADIRVHNPALAARRINGKFAAGSLTDLTSILGLILDVRVIRNGRTLTISQ